MIYLAIEGRLGNQFFQYAFARSLQKKTGEQLVIDYTVPERVGCNGYEESLKYYNVVDYTKTYGDLRDRRVYIIYKVFRKLKPKNLYLKYIYERIFSPLLNIFGIFYIENDHKYIKQRILRNKFKYVKGWFESPKYFEEIDDIIKNELTPIYDLQPQDKATIDKLHAFDTICVTVRRGDFLNDDMSNRFLICTPDYYYHGVEFIKKQIEKPLIYVCSDDIEWCRQNLRFDGEVIFERHGLAIWEKLAIMIECKHFVISNSTFSWWAQHLCKYNNKIVVSPDRWRNEIPLPEAIYEDSWYRYNEIK